MCLPYTGLSFNGSKMDGLMSMTNGRGELSALRV